jgi:hypothetical protein
VITGGSGPDLIQGGTGEDLLKGVDGVQFNDVLAGGRGKDKCRVDFGDQISSC